MNLKFLARSLLLAALLAALTGLPPASLAQEEEPGPQSLAERATVFIMQTYDESGTQALSCVGSGTLISPTGLILTNAHLAQSLGPCRAEKIIVALPVRPGEPPVPTYLAALVQADSQHNLAVLQITAGLDGSLVESATLNLPFVEPGDDTLLRPTEPLTLVGYPDIGARPVTSIDGTLEGFTAETSGGKQAWFRTDATQGGGMTGGGAYNDAGQLVGVLTASPLTSSLEPSATCLNLQDTNRDRTINERDVCVPIAGNVRAARPIRFASTLIASARANIRLGREPGLQIGPPSGAPTISRVFFSAQVDDNDTPTRIVGSLPSGTRSLFLLFNYENMVPGIPYEVRATVDGREIPGFGTGPQMWGGGARGLWYVGVENVAWVDGTYEFAVFLDGRSVQTASIQVGGAEGDEVVAGTFSNLTFGIFDDTGALANQGTLLPADVTTVSGRFDYQGVVDGVDWTEVWYFGDEEVFRNTLFWSDGPGGQKVLNAINAEGLPPGGYQLDVLLGQQLAATASLTLAGTADRSQRSVVFSPITTSNDISREGLPSGVTGNTMPLGTTSIYAFTSWDNMPNGVAWTQHWTRDGQPVASATHRWDSGLVGDNFWVRLFSNEGLAEGTYRVEIFLRGRLMTAATVTVGSGAGALSGQAVTTNAVEVTGRVADAITGNGISGVSLIVLKTEFDFVDFLWDAAQLQSQGLTDRDGRFALATPLPRNTLYTFLVRAEGYLPVIEDGFFVPENQESPMDIRIELTRP